MKSTLEIRSRYLLVLVMLSAGFLHADSSSMILYPGPGTTLNGKAVYFGVRISTGSRVQTGNAMSKITVGTADLDMLPNTTVVIGEPLTLICGMVVVRSGTIEVNDGESSAILTVSQSVGSTGCGDALPNAPSAVRTAARRRPRRYADASSLAATRAAYLDAGVANWSYWTVNMAMLGTSEMSAELTQKCIQAGDCTAVPNIFHSRLAMNGVGLPAVVGVSYLGYYLKKKDKPWWFVPAAAVVFGNVLVSVHAAHYMR